MENKPNNPPAFPGDYIPSAGSGYGSFKFSGMTLLDYFAGLAMQALVSLPPDSTIGMELIATKSYSIAQAMLTERTKHLTQ